MDEEEKARGTAAWLHRNNIFRFYVCPECAFVAADPDILGEHIERHRPSKDAGPFSVLCDSGCGRRFRRSKGNHGGMSIEHREHILLCTGAPPLVVDRRGKHAFAPTFAPTFVTRLAGAYVRAFQGRMKWFIEEGGKRSFDPERYRDLALRAMKEPHGNGMSCPVNGTEEVTGDDDDDFPVAIA